jgi:serine/threonine protein kinase
VYYSSTAQQEFNVLMKLYKWDLSDFISTKPVLDRLSLKILLYQMARALHYLHIKGICHRDVRPSNFLMDQNGRVRLTDFGSAKAVKTNDTSLCYLGSRPYRAP